MGPRFARSILLLAFIVLALVVVIVLVAARLTSTWDSFSKVAGIWVTVLASVVSASASFWVLNQQGMAAKELQSLKGDMERKLEGIKARLSGERKAYDELFAASSSYYYTLSLLELGKHYVKRLQVADQSMVAASRYLIAIPPEDAECWMAYWQSARSMQEAAATLTGQERIALWSSRLAEFARLFHAFEEAARRRLAAPE